MLLLLHVRREQVSTKMAQTGPAAKRKAGNVVIWPDVDNPGKKYADKVAKHVELRPALKVCGLSSCRTR